MQKKARPKGARLTPNDPHTRAHFLAAADAAEAIRQADILASAGALLRRALLLARLKPCWAALLRVDRSPITLLIEHLLLRIRNIKPLLG